MFYVDQLIQRQVRRNLRPYRKGIVAWRIESTPCSRRGSDRPQFSKARQEIDSLAIEDYELSEMRALGIGSQEPSAAMAEGVSIKIDLKIGDSRIAPHNSSGLLP